MINSAKGMNPLRPKDIQMKKRILILGAGPFQKSAIETAKNMGLEVIAMDGNPAAEGLKLANIGLAIDFSDYKKVVDVGKKYDVDGIITICTEVGVVPAAKAAEILKLPGISPETAVACTNKIIMREKLQNAGVYVPKFKGFRDYSNALEFAKKISLPLIIKPSIGSGSRGVRKIQNLSGLKKAFESAKKISKEGKVIIEEFIEGEEVSVECLTYKGKTEVLGISDKIRTAPPYRTDIKVIYPTYYDNKTQKNIIAEVKKAIEAVGLKNGPTHTELLVKNKKAHIVEMAARGGGFKIFDVVLPAICGINAIKASINMALGRKPDIIPRYKKAAMLSFFKEKAGKLISVQGIGKANKIKGILDFTITIKPGEMVKEYTCGDDRIGYFIAVAPTRKEIEAIEKKVENTLKFNIK